MKLTVLLDLDNTLLANDMDQFLPAYLKKLSDYLVDWPPKTIIDNLLAGTRKMITKSSPAGTLEETFDRVFYPALGIQKEQIHPQIDAFYRDVFPSLKALTHPFPEARRLVDFLFQNQATVAIATKPVFPLQAIAHRLEWAGFPIDQTPFAYVPSYELLHFCKPHPEFFAEVLAQLGWPDQPAVIIGDDLADEIIPASKLGLPAYWVTQSGRQLPDGSHPLSDCGELLGAIDWLKALMVSPPEMVFSSPASILSVLNSTPAALDAFSRQLPPNLAQARAPESEWSLGEIICHLRDADREVNLPRFKMIAHGENPFLPGVITDVWAEERQYRREDPSQALQEFIEIRTEMLHLLSGLDEAGWIMPARHAIFGPTQLQELTTFTVTHDRTHVHQAWELIQRLRG